MFQYQVKVLTALIVEEEKMKYLVGYKVVSGDIGKWHSRTTKLKYPELVPVKRPKGWGPLAVFKTLEEAASFTRFRPIFKCLYTKSRARTWWCAGANGYVSRSSVSPPGKDYADEVILIERVQ